MQLHAGTELHGDVEHSELSVVFSGEAFPGRLTRGLKPGEVRLVARTAQGDEALALPPSDTTQARELGAAIAKLARDLKVTAVRVAATDHAQALASAALAAGWQDTRFRVTTRSRPEFPPLR